MSADNRASEAQVAGVAAAAEWSLAAQVAAAERLIAALTAASEQDLKGMAGDAQAAAQVVRAAVERVQEVESEITRRLLLAEAQLSAERRIAAGATTMEPARRQVEQAARRTLRELHDEIEGGARRLGSAAAVAAFADVTREIEAMTRERVAEIEDDFDAAIAEQREALEAERVRCDALLVAPGADARIEELLARSADRVAVAEQEIERARDRAVSRLERDGRAASEGIARAARGSSRVGTAAAGGTVADIGTFARTRRVLGLDVNRAD
jgi:hypothetical protein